VKIGFKQISGYMQTEDVLVGGEESGGISIKGHIPERDGIWMALLIWQWMEESGKSLSELLDEVYGITGNFTFVRSDLTVDKELRALIMNNCENEKYRAFGSYNVLRTENLDGYKFILDDSSWLMIRPSGTEPVLRTYAEAENFEKAKDIIDSVRKVIMTSG
jgi:phosphomannomutase